MSITQPTTGRSSSDNLGCPRCNALLPAQATFCGICGERIDKNKVVSTSPSQNRSRAVEDSDIATHYRITSLVRRRPYVNLFFALDNKQQRMVAIRDIDISSLDEETRAIAIELVESEYDLLRRAHIPHIMSVIDLRHFQNHIFVITSRASQWPTGSSYNADESSFVTLAEEQAGSDGQVQRLYTLQDVLQSGVGLPPEQVALDWAKRLCQSLDNLHQHQIVIGDLDPYTIILNTNNYESQPLLIVSWLLPQLRNLLPRTFTTSNTSYFSAPEALLGDAEPRSDIYSLGAILYLLLTGTPPDEPTWRDGYDNRQGETEHSQRGMPSPLRQRLRSVRELNPRISSGIDECIMRALSMHPAERFQHGEEMAEALRRGRAFEPVKNANSDANWGTPYLRNQPIEGSQDPKEPGEGDEIANVDTVRIVPLSQKNLQRWQSSRLQMRNSIPHRPKMNSSAPQSEEPAQASPLALPDALAGTEGISSHREDIWSFLKQIQRFVLGQQQHATTAAAIIETPLRVQPNQEYAIRLHLIGRDEINYPSGSRKDTPPTGLSALIHGELVLIEVRSALHQNFAYLVQRAAVHIPAHGYEAEVTIPIQPLSTGLGGRRERLHILLMDEERRPLYEKPFVVEIFISPLVQPGREGHNVLTIPL